MRLHYSAILTAIIILLTAIATCVVTAQPEISQMDAAASSAFADKSSWYPLQQSVERVFVVPHMTKDEVIDVLNDNESITRRSLWGCFEKSRCKKQPTATQAANTKLLDELFRNAFMLDMHETAGFKFMEPKQSQVASLVSRALKAARVDTSKIDDFFIMFNVEEHFGRFVAFTIENDVNFNSMISLHSDAVFIAPREKKK